MVLGYARFRRSDGVMAQLQKMISLLKVLPVSSADCEISFSLMNLYHTRGRNRLLVNSVDDILVIGINGPTLAR